jgi:ABC-type uncharacterized transport system substrate-binding protein
MRKTIISFALTALFYALCASAASAQQPAKVSRIGYLAAISLSALAARTEAFRQGLRELGYVEEKTLSLSGDPLQKISEARRTCSHMADS